MIAELRRHVSEFKPDVMHLQAGHLWFNLALPVFRKYPLVLTVHDPRRHMGDKDSAKTPDWIWNLPYRHARRVIVHGQQLRKVVVCELQIDDAMVDVIAPVPDVLPRDRSATDETGNSQPTILFFGRIWPYKGLDYLIRAEPLIAAAVPDVRIVIAGRGEDLTPYRALMTDPARYDVRNGWIDDDERDSLFREASIVVLPYVDASISGVVPIAYTFGKAVVATDVGILPEMVDDGLTGFVVPARDERALANAIVRILTDDDLRRALSARARTDGAAKFDPDAIAGQTYGVYERLLAS